MNIFGTAFVEIIDGDATEANGKPVTRRVPAGTDSNVFGEALPPHLATADKTGSQDAGFTGPPTHVGAALWGHRMYLAAVEASNRQWIASEEWAERVANGLPTADPVVGIMVPPEPAPWPFGPKNSLDGPAQSTPPAPLKS